MRCSKCGADNREGRKFCSKCGGPLARTCSKCGAANEPGEDFCGECGTSLPAPAAANKSTDGLIRIAEPSPTENLEGERKTVTALFADIKGSMELIEDLDPEEARAIVDPALKLMMEAVQRYGGYVAQSIGDGIFALFGAPIAHEDHPQRALYAALRMQEELKRYSDRIRAEGRLPIQARVGVNTGEVVVRSIPTGEGRTEYAPVGHSTGIAARMQALAPVGSIATTEAIRKLCEGYFLFKSLGPTTVKGVSEPVSVYEVTGLGTLRTRLQRAAGRGLTKFVGRQREMDALRHALEKAKGGRGQIVAAMAEPGVGKSRLFHEFKAVSQSGCIVLEAISFSIGKTSAYLPVIDLLHAYFEIRAEDEERKRREKVNGKVITLDRALEDTLPYLFSLLAIAETPDPLVQMDGQVKKRRTLEAIKRILLRESLNQPLIVIFEDLHWVDEQTQEVLNLLADSIATAKILLLVDYRPEYSHLWNNKTYYAQLRLDPLGRETAEEMLSALLGEAKDLSPLKRLIIERTEGTPFFMEEMVQALYEEGVLERNGMVKLARPVSAVRVPATVQAVLASRIDRLPTEEKELLQMLAVLGREFPLGLVVLATVKKGEELEQMLSRLQASEFIYEQPAAHDVEYVFQHALTQEVAYNSLLLERRKLLHERAGQALESMFAGQLDDHLDELAYHYSRGDNVAKAVEYLGRAGQQALKHSAYAGAIGNLSVATNLVQKLPNSTERIQRELFLQLALGPALLSIKGFAAPEVERAYARSRELCEQLGDRPELFHALFGLWVMHHVRGELRTASELAERLRGRAQRAHDPALLIQASSLSGATSYYMGEFFSSREQLVAALSLYDPERHRSLSMQYGSDPKVVSHCFVALTLWQLGYADQAVKEGDELLAWAQRLSHPFTLAFAEYFVGILRQSRREPRAAQERAEAGIRLSEEHGFTQFFAWSTSLRGWAVAERGRGEEGVAQIQEGLDASRAARAGLWRPYFLCLLAETCIETGSFDDGLSALTEALAISDELGIGFSKPEMHRLKGELLLRENDSNVAEANRCFERAIEVAQSQNAKSLQLRATTSLARLLAKQDRRDEARAMLSEIYNWFTEGFDTADLKDAKALRYELQS